MSERLPAARPAQSAAQAISTQMVQLIARYSGRGPTRARTTLNSNLVVVVFTDVMTKGERALTAAGMAGDVRATRLRFQELVRDEAREIVKVATGRGVKSVLADIDPDNDTAVQVFVLDEIAETGEVDVAEASAE